MKRIVVATMTCDFKAYSLEQVVKRLVELEAPAGIEKLVYVNIETSPDNLDAMRGYEFVRDLGLSYDVWAQVSSWRAERAGDQDQGYRLPPIVMARNMAREFAILSGAAAIMYVDSDVLVPVNALPALWCVDRPIVGGLVPGRGAHSHVNYLGSGKSLEAVSPNLVKTDYATAGFVMIRRAVFQVVPWRWGGTVENPDLPHSEDPLFGYDARRAGFDWWYVRTDVKAEHLDNPDRPLRPDGAAKF